jgi:hypothetical protein
MGTGSLVALGAGELVLPTSDASGEKRIDVVEFGAKVQTVLSERGYRQSARSVSESIRRFGGIREAAVLIERFAARPR